MEWIPIAAVLAVLLAAFAVRAARHASARRASRDATVQRLADRAASRADSADTTPHVEAAGRYRVRFRRDGSGEAQASELELPYERAAEADPADLLDGVTYLLAGRATPHDEALVLRLQGRDVAPLLVPQAWLPAFPGEEPVPATPLGETGLAAVYRLTSRAHLAFLSARCLEETGITVADLHSAVEAMLRQRLDDEAVHCALAGAIVELEDDEVPSAAAAHLFVLPDEIDAIDSGAPGRETAGGLLAAVATADRLALGPVGSEAELASWLEGETRREDPSRRAGAVPLTPRILHVTPAGVVTADPPGDSG